MARPLPLGRLGQGEIAIDGRATDLDTPRDGGNPQLLGAQPLNLVVAADPAGVTRLAEHSRRGRELCRWMEGSPEGIQVPPTAEKEPLQGVAQVPHQVEPIDDLDRLRRPLPNPLRIETTAITAHDLDTRVRPQPLRDRGGRAFREQVEHVIALEIAEDGPEPSPAPPGPFVEPDHPGDLQEREGRTMDQTHNRPVTPRHTQGAREPHPRTAANRYAHVPEGRTHAPTVAATDRDEGRKPLGKNPLWTGSVPTEETADLQVQDKRGSGQRQVGHRALVETMHRARTVLTLRTHGRAPPAAEVHMPHAMHPAMGPQAKAGEVRQQSL
jgi:hypothetical protein